MLDANSQFWPIEIEGEYCNKTSFTCHEGFNWLRSMLFGLENVLEKFQWKMDTLLYCKVTVCTLTERRHWNVFANAGQTYWILMTSSTVATRPWLRHERQVRAIALQTASIVLGITFALATLTYRHKWLTPYADLETQHPWRSSRCFGTVQCLPPFRAKILLHDYLIKQ